MYGTPIAWARLSTATTNWTVTGIPGGYKHLLMIWGARTEFLYHGPQARWSYNADTSNINTHFNAHLLEGGAAGNSFVYGPETGSFRQRAISRGDTPTNMFTLYKTIVPNYTSTTTKHTVNADYVGAFGWGAGTQTSIGTLTNIVDTTTGLTSIRFEDNSGSTYSPNSWIAFYGLSG